MAAAIETDAATSSATLQLVADALTQLTPRYIATQTLLVSNFALSAQLAAHSNDASRVADEINGIFHATLAIEEAGEPSPVDDAAALDALLAKIRARS